MNDPKIAIVSSTSRFRATRKQADGEEKKRKKRKQKGERYDREEEEGEEEEEEGEDRQFSLRVISPVASIRRESDRPARFVKVTSRFE